MTRITFDEEYLKSVGYRWNVDHEYMFKQFVHRYDGRRFYSGVFVYKDGSVEVDSPCNSTDKELKLLGIRKEVTL